MISYRRVLLATGTTITQPVAISVLKELEKFLDIGDVDIITTLPVDGFKNSKWTLNRKSNTSAKPVVVKISYNEETDDNAIGKSFYGTDAKPIFQDDSFTIAPVYLDTKLTINIDIEAKSKTLANGVLDKLKLIQLSNRDVVQHNIFYRYYIDSSFDSLFAEMYNLKYPKCFQGTLQEYMRASTDSRATLASTQGGNEHLSQLVFKESQSNVLGRFSTGLNRELNYDEPTGKYTINLEYSITYSKATYIDIHYPITKCNKLLDKEFTEMEYSLPQTPTGSMSKVVDSLSAFKSDKPILGEALELVNVDHIKIPEFDVGITIPPVSNIVNVLSVLVLVEPETRTLFNLKELGDTELSDETIMVMECDTANLTTGNSVLQLSLYNGDKRMGNKYIKYTPKIDDWKILSENKEVNIYVYDGKSFVKDIKYAVLGDYESELKIPHFVKVSKYDYILLDNKLHYYNGTKWIETSLPGTFLGKFHSVDDIPLMINRKIRNGLLEELNKTVVKLYVDEDLNVLVDKELDITGEYRVILSVNTDMSIFSSEVKEKYKACKEKNGITDIEKVVVSKDRFVGDMYNMIKKNNFFNVRIDPSIIYDSDYVTMKTVQISTIMALTKRK